MMKDDAAILYSIDDLPRVVDYLIDQLDDCHILTFEGSLGAGKTTLIRALLKRLGVTDIIASPTFSYVNLYRTDAGKTIYHFDLYRVPSMEEFMLAGFNEYLHEPESLSFIEWPEVIKPLLKNLPACSFLIKHFNGQRVITRQS